MKNIIVLVIISMFCNSAFSQSKEEHFQKSRHLKTTAWILTGTGAALTAAGTILIADGVLKEDNNRNGDDQGKGAEEAIVGAGITVLGLAAIGTAIPFFIRSHKEHKRAITFNFKNETIQLVRNTGLTMKCYPALSLRIGL